MGLTNSQKMLITALCDNDLKKAKGWAMHVLDEDTTQKNKQWCEYKKNELNASDAQLIELPPNIKGLLAMENENDLFREDRYFLTQVARKAFDKICLMKDVSQDLASMGVPYHNATLLYGPSGTGKTMFGKYTAYKLGLLFAYLNFSSLIDSLLGKTAQNLQRIFDYICQTPCVFMLDELDCIAINRAGDRHDDAGGELSRTTICLMQQLDKLPNNIVLLAATNRFDRLDDAVIRRFPNKIEFQPMNSAEMASLQNKYLESVGIDIFEDCDEVEQILLADMTVTCDNQSEMIDRLIEWIAERISRQKQQQTETGGNKR